MGEAKRRGNAAERKAEAMKLRASEIEDTRRDCDLPADASFAGYVVYIREKDDYLMDITETDSQIHRKYCRTPELAARYMDRYYAEQIAAKLPRKAEVCLMFDIGKQLLVAMDK